MVALIEIEQGRDRGDARAVALQNEAGASDFQRAIRLAHRLYESLALPQRRRAAVIRNSNFDDARLAIESESGRETFPVDLLADTRQSLAKAIARLAAINAGAPIARPLTRQQAVNIVTEQIGLFESVLRQYDNKNGDWRRIPALPAPALPRGGRPPYVGPRPS